MTDTRPDINDPKYDRFEKNPNLIVANGEFGICHYGGWLGGVGFLLGGGYFVLLCKSALAGDVAQMPFQLLMALIGAGMLAIGIYLERRLSWYARWKAWKIDFEEMESNGRGASR